MLLVEDLYPQCRIYQWINIFLRRSACVLALLAVLAELFSNLEVSYICLFAFALIVIYVNRSVKLQYFCDMYVIRYDAVEHLPCKLCTIDYNLCILQSRFKKGKVSRLDRQNIYINVFNKQTKTGDAEAEVYCVGQQAIGVRILKEV